MATLYVANSLAGNMFPDNCTISKTRIDADIVRDMCNDAVRRGCFVSAVGHKDTANVLREVFDLPVTFCRISIDIDPGDVLIVAQVMGPRLPEGCTVLPEGTEMQFFLYSI